MGVGVITAMITIKNDGTIEPFGIKILRESRLQLTAPTRDITESSDEFDGEVDFGTELKSGHWMLVGITDEGLDATGKMQARRNIAKQLDDLRQSGDHLKYESDPDKKIFVTLNGRAEVEEYPTWLKVHIPLNVNPFWESEVENQFTGSGIITNEGTLDTPLIVEVRGLITDPEVTVGGKTLKYTGTLTAMDTLTINAEHGTVTLSGVNALKYYEGGFPVLPIGETPVIAANGGITTFRWRERFI